MGVVSPKKKPVRETFVTIRCTPAFKAWLVGFAEAQRSSPSHVIDQGVAELARARGVGAPPPR